MGKGAVADEGGIAVGRPVQPLVEHARHMGQMAQVVLGHPGFKAHLQHQIGNDADQIGVAAALAQAVQRALDLTGAGAHGGQTIGHGVLGVVVAMDAQVIAGNDGGDGADDRLDLMGQRSAVGVAQHHPARPGLIGGAHAR